MTRGRAPFGIVVNVARTVEASLWGTAPMQFNICHSGLSGRPRRARLTTRN